MRTVYSYRANKILYNFIISNHLSGNAIIPANICSDVVETIVLTGMTPIFVDIDCTTLCLDIGSILEYVPSSSLLIFVHTYGIEKDGLIDPDCVKKINPSIAIVDDKCLCMPDIEPYESKFDLTLYSLGRKKQVELGCGGIGYINGDWLYSEIFVQNESFLSNEDWILDKSRFLQVKEATIELKTRINKIYKSNLPDSIQIPSGYQNWRFNIQVENKDVIIKELFSNGLFASSHYISHLESCINAVNLQKKIINLFNDFYYTEEQALKTCSIINKCLKICNL